MSDIETDQAEAPKPKRKPPIVVAIGMLVLGAGAGYGFVHADPLKLMPEPEMAEVEAGVPTPVVVDGHIADEAPAFIALEPVVIGLGANAPSPHLRFAATLDVVPSAVAQVEAVVPRIADVLVTYLRAVDPQELADPAAMFRLRAQMMRRIDLVAGPGAVRDLLITEFILG